MLISDIRNIVTYLTSEQFIIKQIGKWKDLSMIMQCPFYKDNSQRQQQPFQIAKVESVQDNQLTKSVLIVSLNDRSFCS